MRYFLWIAVNLDESHFEAGHWVNVAMSRQPNWGSACNDFKRRYPSIMQSFGNGRISITTGEPERS